jgi:hypothetical protein
LSFIGVAQIDDGGHAEGLLNVPGVFRGHMVNTVAAE